MRTLETEIEELRKELDSMRNELQVKEAALAWLEQRLRKEPATAKPNRMPEPQGVIDLSKISVADMSKRKTLVDAVKDVTKKLGAQEFTVAQIQAVMAELGIEFSAKNPRASLSVALGKLQDQGWLVVTKEGKGNNPHMYKVALQSSANPINEEATDLV